jgi:hypothetical protein
MDSHSRILLSEATQLLNMTRRRIEQTAALLVKAAAAEQLPSPRALARRSGVTEGESHVSGSGRDAGIRP